MGNLLHVPYDKNLRFFEPFDKKDNCDYDEWQLQDFDLKGMHILCEILSLTDII